MFLPAYLAWAFFIAGGFVAMDGLLKRMLQLGLSEFWQKSMSRFLPLMFILLALGLNWRWVDLSKTDSFILFAKDMLYQRRIPFGRHCPLVVGCGVGILPGGRGPTPRSFDRQPLHDRM